MSCLREYKYKCKSRKFHFRLEFLLLVDMPNDQSIKKTLSQTASNSNSINSARQILSRHTQLHWFYRGVDVLWRESLLNKFNVPLTEIVTKLGLCINFNMIPVEELLNIDEVADDFIYNQSSFQSSPYENLNKSAPWKASNIDNVLSIIFNTVVQDDRYRYDDFNIFDPLEGYRIFVHNPDEFPSKSTNKFFLRYRFNTESKIRPEMTLTDESLRSISFRKRNCYFPGEKILKYFKVYTKNNCEQESLSLFLVISCGCVPFYLIREYISNLKNSSINHFN